MTQIEVSAQCENQGSGGWKASVSNPDCEAHAKRLDQLKKQIAQGIHEKTGVELCEIVVRLEGAFPEAIDQFRNAHEKISQANVLRDQGAKEIRSVVASLRDQHLTMRDIAALLDITPQRVAQLLQS